MAQRLSTCSTFSLASALLGEQKNKISENENLVNIAVMSGLISTYFPTFHCQAQNSKSDLTVFRDERVGTSFIESSQGGTVISSIKLQPRWMNVIGD
jgi:hypothetical protein